MLTDNGPDCTWYLLVVNGKPQGPFTADELKICNLKPGDFVKTPLMDDYREAHQVPELCRIFKFKNQAVMPQYYASFDQRVLAAVLDWFMIGGFFVIIAFTASLFIFDKAKLLSLSLSLIVIIPVTQFIYHIIMEASAKQATYGKQLLNIKVSDPEGQRINLKHAFIRNAAKLASVLTFFIGYLLSFFNKRQQCLHDMIAGTLVIKDRLI